MNSDDFKLNICRLCSKNSNGFTDLLIKIENDVDWANIAEKYFNISISSYNNSVTKICEDCSEFLKKLHRFSDVVQKTDLLLLDVFSSTKIVTEDEIIQLRHKYKLTEDDGNIENLESVSVFEGAGVKQELKSIEKVTNEMILNPGDAKEDESQISDYETDICPAVEYSCDESDADDDDDDLPLIKLKGKEHGPPKFEEHNENLRIKRISPSTSKSKPQANRSAFDCEYCQRKFDSKRRLIVHIQRMHGNEQTISNIVAAAFECEFCNKIFVSKLYHDKHIQSKICRPDELLECDECSRKYSSKEKLKNHLSYHKLMLTKTKHSCKHCDKEFATKARLVSHLKEFHVPEEKDHVLAEEMPHYQCDKCNKVFMKKIRYEKHLLNFCRVGQEFLCEICSKTFLLKDGLRAHLTTHIPSEFKKRAQCKHCEKSFNSQRRLNYHINRVHLRRKPYVCEVCGKRFADSTDFKNHKFTHSNDLIFQCSQCDLRFKTRYVLRNHVNSQHNMIKFPCVVCESEFNSQKNLRRHMVKHSQDKNYKCEECGEAFKRLNTLKLHVTKHSDVRPHACRICPATFKVKQSALTHEKTVHKMIIGATDER